jgi:hypothetical protein
MTEWYPDEQIRELATLPPASPARKSMETRLAAASAVERRYWLSFLAQTDWLYASMADVQVPAALQDRLLAIADAAPPAGWARPTVYRVAANWKWLAACLLLALSLRNYLSWETASRLPRDIPLNSSLAATITRQAVQFDETSPPLEVAAADPAKVQAALAAHAFSFPVMVLHPQGSASLLGGGACDLGGTPAAFTRWRDGAGLTYTVFQFDGTTLGIPAVFRTTAQSPTDLWHGDAHYRVVIWSGKVGKCTWALVMDSDQATDMFSNSTY